MNHLAVAASQTAVDLENISILNAGIVAVLGYAVVFVGLIALMVVVILLGKAFTAAEKKKAAEPASAPAVEVTALADSTEQPSAPGTAGALKLYDTPPKTAAMIMAIVADKLGKPVNELRFISIKEVK